MENGLRVVIIGGVACGPKTASRLKRLLPDTDITMVERGGWFHMVLAVCPIMSKGCVPKLICSVRPPLEWHATRFFLKK